MERWKPLNSNSKVRDEGMNDKVRTTYKERARNLRVMSAISTQAESMEIQGRNNNPEHNTETEIDMLERAGKLRSYIDLTNEERAHI